MEQSISPAGGLPRTPVVRVFVSGTFSDMHSERDLLVRRVFPELRSRCKSLRASLVEIDLRWGVPADTTPARTLEICMAELRRCEEENKHPFFLCLLGGRYGWVPSADVLDSPGMHGTPLREAYSLRSGCSITHHEINLAVLRRSSHTSNPHASFFLRSDDFLANTEAGRQRKEWVDDGEKGSKLEALKNQIKAHCSESHSSRAQLRSYSCLYDGFDQLNRMHKLKGLDPFCVEVLSVLGSQIQTYLASLGGNGQASLMLTPHQIAGMSGANRLVGRDYLLDQLCRALESGSERAILVTGAPGCGKSTLICHALNMLEGSNPNIACISYFHTSHDTSTTTHVVSALCSQLERLVTEQQLLRHAVVAGDENADTNADANATESASQRLAKLLDTWDQTSLQRGKRLVLALENIERLEPEARSLQWLPRNLPPGVIIVAGMARSRVEGTELESPTGVVQRLRRRVSPNAANSNQDSEQSTGWLKVIDVPLLQTKERCDVVTSLLGQWNKTLSNSQMETLVTKAGAGTPLFLTMACLELRVVGVFENLDVTISSLAHNAPQLCQQILHRLEADHGGEIVVGTCLSFVALAVEGLFEGELRELVSDVVYGQNTSGGAYATAEKHSPENAKSMFPGAKWAYLMHSMENIVARMGGETEEQGALRIARPEMESAVLERYGKQYDTKFHMSIAQYFSGHDRKDARALRLHLHHLCQAGKFDDLVPIISQLQVFSTLWTASSACRAELLQLWKECGSTRQAADVYTQALTQGKGKSQHGVERHVLEFLRNASMFDHSRMVLEGMLRAWGEVQPSDGQDGRDLTLTVLGKVASDSISSSLLPLLVGDLAQFGECLRKLGRFEEASEVFALTLAAIPITGANKNNTLLRNKLMLLSLARCELLAKLGEYDEALRGYQETVSLAGSADPRLEVELLENMGELQRKLGQLSGARELFERAIEIKESCDGKAACWKLMGNLGEVFLKQGDLVKCGELYKQALRGAVEYQGAESLDVSKVLASMSELEIKQGDYSSALDHLHKSISLKRKLQGDTHPDVAKPLNLLGEAYTKQGQLQLARDALSEALDIRERAFGVHNVECAKVLNNLGEVMLLEGDLEGAERQFRDAAGIWEDALGPDHTNVAKAANNLGDVLRKMGRYEEALQVFTRALRIRELAVGEDHVDSAKILSNVALMYHKLNKLDMAERRYRKAHEVMVAGLGPRHPKVAAVVFRMAKLQVKLGNYTEAQQLFEQALEIRIGHFGPKHVDVAEALNGLAEILVKLHHHDDAEEMYNRCLQQREELLPPDHPDLAEVLNNMGELYHIQQRFDEAELFFTRALEIRQKGKRPEEWTDCTETAKVLNNLGTLMADQGNTVVAAPLLMRALSMRERVLGKEHPDIAKVLKNIAVFLDAADPQDLKRAGVRGLSSLKIRKYFDRAVAIRLRSHGPNHPQLCDCTLPLANHHIKHNQPYLAERLLHQAVDIRAHSFGFSHTETISACNQLLEVYNKQDKNSSVQKFLRKLVEDCDRQEGMLAPITQQWFARLVGVLSASGNTIMLKRLLLNRKKLLSAHFGGDEQALEALAFIESELHKL